MTDNPWDAALYDGKHAFVYEYGKELLALLAPQPGECILDIGCGTGHLTACLGEAGARVVGLDSSPAMIEAARRAYPALEFVLADARKFAFPEPFDAVFSNATLHWIPEAGRVAACVARALRSRGRFVAEFGGRGNVARITWAVQRALWELTRNWVEPGWYFPSIGEYAALLADQGLEVRSALLFDRPTALEDGELGLRNWLAMFGAGMFHGVAPEVKEEALARVEARLRPGHFREGQWTIDYRRLRVVAYKE